MCTGGKLQVMQVPDTAARLIDLPREVLGVISRPLSLKDRVTFSITCRALLHSLASSQDAWGTLQFITPRRWPPILVWLGRRWQGSRCLELSFAFAPEGEEWQAAAVAQLAMCLEGSPLVQLDLSHLRLSGEQGSLVLQRLDSCTTLTSLALRSCELSHLPAALEQLPALADLSLASNYKLGGACCGRLKQLTALTRLDISGCGLAVLPAELAVLPVLAALDLGGNEKLGAAKEETWGPLTQCSSLTALDLGCIPFARVPFAVAALAPHLVDIRFGDIFGGGHWAGGEATAGPLYRLTGLTRLDLIGCLRDLPLPEQLSCLVSLEDLELSFNNNLGNGLPLRPLSCLTALTRLSFFNSTLRDLPEELSHLQALKVLDFGVRASDPGMGISWQHLRRLMALTRLSFIGWKLERLPPELAELRSLAHLCLSYNELLGGCQDGSSEDAATNWAVLEQLTALTSLSASNCNLQAVPAAFTALTQLLELRLSGNRPLGRGGVEALRPLVNMTALQHLDLADCCLPRELEVDAIPFTLHRLEGWAERIKDLTELDIANLRLG